MVSDNLHLRTKLRDEHFDELHAEGAGFDKVALFWQAHAVVRDYHFVLTGPTRTECEPYRPAGSLRERVFGSVRDDFRHDEPKRDGVFKIQERGGDVPAYLNDPV